jgi:hypothetical protein
MIQSIGLAALDMPRALRIGRAPSRLVPTRATMLPTSSGNCAPSTCIRMSPGIRATDACAVDRRCESAINSQCRSC